MEARLAGAFADMSCPQLAAGGPYRGEVCTPLVATLSSAQLPRRHGTRLQEPDRKELYAPCTDIVAEQHRAQQAAGVLRPAIEIDWSLCGMMPDLGGRAVLEKLRVDT